MTYVDTQSYALACEIRHREARDTDPIFLERLYAELARRNEASR